MNHINPDGKMVGTGQKVDMGELPFLHIYSQPCEHFPAQIIGNRKALEILKVTIERALTMPVDADTITISGFSNDGYTVPVIAAEQEEFFATDGEGYGIYIKLLPDSPEKIPMVENLWDRHPPHYCDRGYDDDTHK